MAGLLDHLVGAGKDRWRDGEAEYLCRLEIEDQLEFARLLDWEISGLSPLENLVDVGRGVSPHVRETRPVTHQSANFDKRSICIHRRQVGSRYKVDEVGPMHTEHRGSKNKKSINLCPPHFHEGTFELIRAACVHK